MTVPPSGHDVVDDLGGHLAHLGDEDGAPGLDLLADRVQRDVPVFLAVHRSDPAGEHAGIATQQHAQRAAQHPDQHADQTAARNPDPGGDVIALGHPHRAVRSPLQQRGRPDLQPSRGVGLPQLAQRLVGLLWSAKATTTILSSMMIFLLV